ncbi:GL20170 [Drosophila persimilis]|uniref:GL20170 n=1 Tax=Drosophila persimilis TaxID=7234 RepID=B4GXZ4_DROPE|nr:GL20170 [Drosophila persimilis]
MDVDVDVDMVVVPIPICDLIDGRWTDGPLMMISGCLNRDQVHSAAFDVGSKREQVEYELGVTSSVLVTVWLIVLPLHAPQFPIQWRPIACDEDEDDDDDEDEDEEQCQR